MTVSGFDARELVEMQWTLLQTLETLNWTLICLILLPYTYNLKDLNYEELIGSFYDRELQKTKL